MITTEQKAQIAQEIWAVMREHEDRCDLEVEDVWPEHMLWAVTDIVIRRLSAENAILLKGIEDHTTSRSAAYRRVAELSAENEALRAQTPDFQGSPKRKLERLTLNGYRINGVAFERADIDGVIERGFITVGGLVGWWWPDTQAELEQLRAQVEALTKPKQIRVALDFKQAHELLDMFGGAPGLVTLMPGDGHSGKGLYAYWTEVPEEGEVYLGVTDYDAAPTPQELTRPAVPEFTSIAQRKLDELVEEGFQVTGYAIQRDSTRGFVDSAGFVGWWTRPAVPEGWKLVPVEPTEEMIVAFAEEWYSHAQTIDDPQMIEAYRALLAAAPQPSQQEAVQRGDS